MTADTIEPGTQEELAEALKAANEAGRAVIPRGGGTKQDWGNPPLRSDLMLSTARLNRVIEHAWADLTVTVQAGCTISCLQQTLARHGQRLAADVLWPDRATVGGIVSVNDSGALRLRYGGLRDLIIGITLALPDGTLAKSGGKVVKNVAGYDLPKLATGALGTLGVITQAVFRLHPLPQNPRTFSIHAGSLAEAQNLLLAIQDSRLAHSALQWRLPENELDILIEGTPAGLASQAAQLRSLAGTAAVSEGSAEVWSARERLWLGDGAIAKFSVLPSEIAGFATKSGNAMIEAAVIQATGIGCVRLDADRESLQALRTQLESNGGSFVILRQPRGARPLDTWGSAGDALPLMRALKRQFDPQGTLNPGRFAGGI